jgi:serine/threonine protein kinase
VLRGKYRLDAILGVGGMAVVYRATHTRNEKEVAIKMLLPEHSSNDEIGRRFRDEGRFANKVRHPGAVSINDDDVSEDGAAYLVLELLHGVACDELCSRCGERLPVDAACAVGWQALDVLRAAHDRGVIHRDVKPANLFVLADGTVKVLDFGIACLRESVTTGAHTTKTGIQVGTPAFMAPEQAGTGMGVDGRADIWGVGATLFALLTGSDVSRPARSLGEVAPEMPGPLVDVVDRALQFDPAHRWPSAAAMQSALAEASPRWASAASARAVLASLLQSLGAPARPGEASNRGGPSGPLAGMPRWPALPALAKASRVANSVSPTVHSRRPALPRWSRLRLPSIGIGAAAVLLAGGLAEGWFVGLSEPARPAVAPPSHVAPPPVDSTVDVPQPLPIPVDEGKPSGVVSHASGIPRSCTDALRAGRSSDGIVKIDPDGAGPIRPFDVYCAGMGDGPGSDLPREYLTLAHGEATGEPDANATRYVWGGSCGCPDLVLRFTRVRLDPRAMTVDPSDNAFATYNREQLCEAHDRNHCGERTKLAWGSPGSCRGPDDTSGSASIDLRGTPFALAPSVRFVAAGFGANGTATLSKDRKTASVVGGGQCGRMVPEKPTIALTQAR